LGDWAKELPVLCFGRVSRDRGRRMLGPRASRPQRARQRE
jgi:hypothetical protein